MDMAMAMTDDDRKDVFELSGPTYLRDMATRSIFKSKLERQALMACLVKSVYVAERDRQQGRYGEKAQAPHWWMELGYEVEYFIREPGNLHHNIIVGAVLKRNLLLKVSNKISPNKYFGSNNSDYYNYNDKPISSDSNSMSCNNTQRDKPQQLNYNYHQQLNDNIDDNSRLEAPMVVVAFRGTELAYEDSFCHDLFDNMQMLFLQLHKSIRFKIALESVKHAIGWVGVPNVSIAGHSLGAAIALLIGEHFALEGNKIECHLFNPPFPSIPLEQIFRFSLLKHPLNLMTSALGGLLLNFDARQEIYRSFFTLRTWFPHMYINTQDPLSSNYLDYFSPHELLHKIGASGFSRLIAPLSFIATINNYLGGESKAFHLTPCAHLYIIKHDYGKQLMAHALSQWWSIEYHVNHKTINIYKDE